MKFKPGDLVQLKAEKRAYPECGGLGVVIATDSYGTKVCWFIHTWSAKIYEYTTSHLELVKNG